MRKINLLSAFYLAASLVHGQSAAPGHDVYDKLLRRNVTADGKVNYRAFIKDSTALNQYLQRLSSHPPDEKTWSTAEQMAYWINAYNAFTIKLIITHYPVKSIKDIGSSIQVPFVNTPWDIKFIRIGKNKMDLNNIEHSILRKKFHDPRVHMALVCASKSCPILLNEAYTPQHLDEQLTKQTKIFLADPSRNKVLADQPRLSMIFNWYAMDFKRNGSSVRDFINQYSNVIIKPDVKISYLKYDWSLND